MFFSKLIVPALAIFGFATTALASPVGTSELVARDASSDAVTELQGFAAVVADAVVKLDADIKAKVDIAADIDVFVDLFGKSADSYKSKPSGILVAADIDLFVSVALDIVVKLVVAVSAIVTLDLSIFAKIDVFLSAWLSALDAFSPGCAALIGKGIPTADLAIFATLKLLLSAKVLVIIDILGIIIL